MAEICICAAVRAADGYIVRGHRHCDCLRTMALMHKLPDLSPSAQGFMTSANRFVGREEAMQLQKAANQRSACSADGKHHGTILLSEDLY